MTCLAALCDHSFVRVSAPGLKAIYSKTSHIPSQPGVRLTYCLEQRSGILEGEGPKQSGFLAHLNWAETLDNRGFCVCNLSLNRQEELNYARELSSFLTLPSQGLEYSRAGDPSWCYSPPGMDWKMPAAGGGCSRF